MIYSGESSSVSHEESAPQGDPGCAGKMSEGRCSKARVWKLDSSRPKPVRMEETLEGGRGPPRAVVPLGMEMQTIKTEQFHDVP